MKAFTLWQPWATFIALGIKTVETRAHFNYRGTLWTTVAIHAAQTRAGMASGLAQALTFLYRRAPEVWTAERMDELARQVDRERGLIVAEARVVKVDGMQPEDAEKALVPHDPRLVSYHLEDVLRFPQPIPVRGAQGLWAVPGDALREMERQRHVVKRKQRADEAIPFARRRLSHEDPKFFNPARAGIQRCEDGVRTDSAGALREAEQETQRRKRQ